jgi:hypothetical protein
MPCTFPIPDQHLLLPPSPAAAGASPEDIREKGELQRTYYALLHAVVHNGLAGALLKAPGALDVVMGALVRGAGAHRDVTIRKTCVQVRCGVLCSAALVGLCSTMHQHACMHACTHGAAIMHQPRAVLKITPLALVAAPQGVSLSHNCATVKPPGPHASCGPGCTGDPLAGPAVPLLWGPQCCGCA